VPDLDLTELRDMLPFAKHLGLVVTEASPDVVRAELAHSPELCTSGGILHGGAMMSVADTCGGICAFLNLPDGATGTATIESKTNFLRGVSDGTLTATTTPLHRGRTMIVLETELARGDGKLAAKVTQSQTFLYPR
jgi:uncharacterized protein (TIGR00369 family)